MLTAATGLLDGHEATVHWVADTTKRLLETTAEPTEAISWAVG